MQNIKTIIAPIDFSDASINALIYAINLANKSNVRLIILHVDDIIQRSITGTAGLEDYDEFINEKLEKITYDHLYGKNLIFEFKIYQGDVKTVIKNVAKKLQADLIIMGRKEKGSLYEERMGSITVSLLDHPSCAVLAIPESSKKLEMNTITVASDMVTSFPERQLYTLHYLAESRNSRIQIVKINRLLNPVLEPAGGNAVRDKFDNLLAAMTHEYHEINNEDLIHGLEKFILHYNSDLLVLLKKNKPAKESVFGPRLSNVMTLSAKIPLLIIPIDN